MLAGAHGIDAGAAGGRGRRVGDAADPRALPHLPAARHRARPRRPDQVRPGRRGRQALAELEVRELVAGRSSRARRSCASRPGRGDGLPELRGRAAELARERAAPRGGPPAAARRPRLHAARLRHRGHGDRGRRRWRWGRRSRCCPPAVARACAGCRCTARRRSARRPAAARRSTWPGRGGGGGARRRAGPSGHPAPHVDARRRADAAALREGARRPRPRTRARGQRGSARARAAAERGALAPGATAVAQLRLESPAVAGRGDRLVLRSYSPADTIGGALVLDPMAPRRRATAGGAALRVRFARGGRGAWWSRRGPAGIDAPLLAARLTLPVDELAAALAASGVAVLGQDPPSSSPARARQLGEAALGRSPRSTAPSRSRPACRARSCGRGVREASPAAFERVLADLAAAGSCGCFRRRSPSFATRSALRRRGGGAGAAPGGRGGGRALGGRAPGSRRAVEDGREAPRARRPGPGHGAPTRPGGRRAPRRARPSRGAQAGGP